MKAIYWLRSDLRFHDNEALFLAAHKSTELAFVYTRKPTGPYRAQFLEESLADLDQRLREKGHKLQVTELSITELIKQNPEIEAVFYTREYAFNERQEEAQLAKLPLKTIGVDQGALLKESELPFPANSMPFVFSDFRRKIEGHTYQFKTAPPPRQW
ncbi:MAG: deoxyribodipyrimidine photo-lyase, partial [Bacteriovoracia bacterium]